MGIRREIVIALVLTLAVGHCGSVASEARVRRTFPPVLWKIDAECATPVTTSAAGIEVLVGQALSTLKRRDPQGYSDDTFNREVRTRAYAAQLNASPSPEYFVPLSCGATGDCTWGVFSIHPKRFLGFVGADRIYIHKRRGRWAAITGELSFSAAESDVATFVMGRRGYRQATGWRRYDPFPGEGGPELPRELRDAPSDCAP